MKLATSLTGFHFRGNDKSRTSEFLIGCLADKLCDCTMGHVTHCCDLLCIGDELDYAGASRHGAVLFRQKGSPMTTPSGNDIVIRLDTIDQLFNAPDLNPFSEEEVDVLGEPAMMRVVRRLQARRVRNWEGVKLILELPADQITPGLEAQTEQALRRYSDAKIEDNKLQIRLSRIRSLIGLAMVTAISVVVIGIAYLLFNAVFTNASQTVKGVIAAAISVFVWVILWDPMEQLLFDWVQPRLENNILRKIQGIDVVIRAKS